MTVLYVEKNPKEDSNVFFYLWISASVFSSLYSYIWDIKMDWGLFDRNAGENKFLREEIVYSSTVSKICPRQNYEYLIKYAVYWWKMVYDLYFFFCSKLLILSSYSCIWCLKTHEVPNIYKKIRNLCYGNFFIKIFKIEKTNDF